jgi:sugar phosphate isomerase/epimerase
LGGDPEGSKKIAKTFRECCIVAEDHGERLAAEGENCWGGMHSWKRILELLELVGRPQTLGFQADMAHTLVYTIGYNALEDAILPQGFDWKDERMAAWGVKTIDPSAASVDDRLPRCAKR